MKYMLVLFSILSMMLGQLQAASRNQTFSEPYIAFTYNSHLVDHIWGLDESGIP